MEFFSEENLKNLLFKSPLDAYQTMKLIALQSGFEIIIQDIKNEKKPINFMQPSSIIQFSKIDKNGKIFAKINKLIIYIQFYNFSILFQSSLN